MSHLDTGISVNMPRFWHCRLPRFTQIIDILDNTSWGSVSGAPKESSVPLPDLPEEGNAEALPLILARQQYTLPAGEFRTLSRVLLPLHGGKAGPQEDGVLAILGI